MPVFGQGRSGALVASTAMKAAMAGRQRGYKGPQPVALTDAEREEVERRLKLRRERKSRPGGKNTYQQP